MITPDDIRDQRFLVALRGYDRDEVAAFLEQVASEVANVQARVKELEALLAKERNRASAPTPAADATDESAAPRDTRDLFRSLGDETTRILVAAEESAREIEHKAQQHANEQLEQARRGAREETERANRQAAKLIADAERRRDAIAAAIRDLEAQRDRLVGDLRTAVEAVSATSEALQGSITDTAAADTPQQTPPEEQPEEPAETVPAETVPAEQTETPPDAPSASYAIDTSQTEIPAEDAEAEAALQTLEAEAEREVAAADGSVPGRRDATLSPLRDDMARKLRRGLQDVQNSVLEAIRTEGRQGQLEALLPREQVLDDLGSQGQDFLTQGYEAGLVDAAAEVTGDVPKHLVEGARLPAASATLRAVLSHEVVSALRATLRAGLEADEAETSLSERVGEVFRDLKGPVLEAVVSTHLDRIYWHGLLDAWQDLGVQHIRWQVGDEPRCPEQRCRSNAEEGAVDLGVDFPSGDRVPPAHQGCTCVIVPENQ